jgi:hypothetical protein
MKQPYPSRAGSAPHAVRVRIVNTSDYITPFNLLIVKKRLLGLVYRTKFKLTTTARII